jgi:uncharacterized protein YqgV (UPF0045/DUF77 family)
VVVEVSCQFSFYSLGAEHQSPAIKAAVSVLERRGLAVESGSMSSIVTGPADALFAALAEAFVEAAEGGLVLVATISNACPTR